jgi:hypothetical protein
MSRAVGKVAEDGAAEDAADVEDRRDETGSGK